VTGDDRELRLESISSRFIGGRSLALTGQPVEEVALSSALPGYQHDGNDTYYIEQAYVQRLVPVGRVRDEPVLLVHGGGMTGACWESTPDGRPGWLTVFLRAGLPVDVLDNVERGRAGWCAAPRVWPGKPIMRGEREMWEVFRLGRPEDYDVLVGHSQGGGLCARVALARPDLVRQVVLIEPHGLPDVPGDSGKYPSQLTVIGDFTELSPMWVHLTADMRRHSAQLRAAGARADVLDCRPPASGGTPTTR
jgi:pimeloyl-ACP methyl ester carboxylesterase